MYGFFFCVSSHVWKTVQIWPSRKNKAETEDIVPRSSDMKRVVFFAPGCETSHHFQSYAMSQSRARQRGTCLGPLITFISHVFESE